ncbi:MAG TPA: glycoside hydrolase family 38 C-terminal domain-containing protein [Bacteroidota bacterium]|nr:glycoside hydrolase family 38 C-terminal domain-containing protein [Bacteroidota bacterium]
MSLRARTAVSFILILLLPTIAAAQLRESIERNARLLHLIEGSVEGYETAIAGTVINYPRLRDDRPEALITRATTGTMAIEWSSSPAPRRIGSDDVTFVVSAGILTRPDTHLKFELSVNDAPRVSFVSTDTTSWHAGDSGGVRLDFDAALRDQHTDAFGYLRIHIPASMIVPGQPMRFKVVGEAAGSNGWFMVFKDNEVLPYLRKRVAHDDWCDVSFGPDGRRLNAVLTAPLTWIDKQVSYSLNTRSPRPLTLSLRNDSLQSFFSFDAAQSDRFQLLVDGNAAIDAKGILNPVSDARLTDERIVTVKSRATGSNGWALTYESMYAPRLRPSLALLSDSSRGSGRIHFIISTHQDIAWMDSPEQCIKDRDEKILTPTLALMKEDPGYRFDLEDVLFLREYLERHPDRKDDLLKFMSEGRLGVGAAFNQPYEDLSSGEMLVREFYAGRKWLRKNFPGCDTKTYWNVDVPGRAAQMPQIMHKAGVKYLFMSRFEKGLYRWLSPDGSGVLAFSPGHYGDFAEGPGRRGFTDMAGFISSFATQWGSILPNGSKNVPVVSMSDMSTPVRYTDIFETWNDLRSGLIKEGGVRPLAIPPIGYSTADRFFESVAAEDLQLPSVQGERPNIWLYIHGPTHHWAIAAKREADVFLPAAETFSTIESLLEKSFARYPQQELTEAWESQIYPDHGWGGKNGDITDSTFRAKFEHARDVAQQIYTQATTSIAGRVSTVASKGIPVVVFNNLSWKRTSPVQCSATFARGQFQRGLAIYDALGRLLSSQILSFERHPDGSIKSALVLFVAEDVPPVGYSTFYVRQSPVPLKADTTSQLVESLSGRFYRIAFSPGGIRQITDTELQKELLKTEKFLGAELFTMQSVGEDAGEWSEPQQPTMEGFDKMSNYKPAWHLVESGPVRQVAEVRLDSGHAVIVQRVVLYNALKQIDFETSLLKWDGTKYREFRLAFPMNMVSGQVAYEAPFTTIEVGKDEMKGAAGERYKTVASTLRPRSIQRWISVSDAEFGVTLSSSVPVWDFTDPTDQPMESPMLQPVLLASRRSCHGLGPWYLQQGDHFFRFSLTSHRAGWRNGRRFGVAANNPMGVVFNPPSTGKPTLPEERGFFSLGVDNAVLSTMKKCDDDDSVILRLYEDAGKNSVVRARFMTQLARAQSTNIIEDEGIPASFKLDELVFPLMHWSIQTLKVTPKL